MPIEPNDLKEVTRSLGLKLVKLPAPKANEELRIAVYEQGEVFRLFYVDKDISTVPMAQHAGRRYVDIVSAEQEDAIHIGYGEDAAAGTPDDGMIGYLYKIFDEESMEEALHDVHNFLTAGIYPQAGSIANLH